jgi:hypothetical protein
MQHPKGYTKPQLDQNRVARFFLVHDTKSGTNVPNEHKMYQMVIKYTKYPYVNIPNGHKIFQLFPIWGPRKFTQIGILGLKINHLATLDQNSIVLVGTYVWNALHIICMWTLSLHARDARYIPRRSISGKSENFFSWSPTHFVKWREVL